MNGIYYRFIIFTVAMSLVSVNPVQARDYLTFAVTPSGYDDMGEILTEMDRTWHEISFQDLADYYKIKGYRGIFINSKNVPDKAADKAVESLRRYVSKGGVVYASDWAIDFIVKAFPGKINLYGPEHLEGKRGDEQIIHADITHTGLAAYLDPSSPPLTLTLKFDQSDWVVIDTVADDVRTYLRGDIKIKSFRETIPYTDGSVNDEYDGSSAKTITNRPLLVSFAYGAGSVVYTGFHNGQQLTDLQKKLLVYFMLIPETFKTLQQMKSGLESGNPDIDIEEFIGTINHGEISVPVFFSVPVPADLIIAAGWEGSEIKLSVYGPDGQLHESSSSSNPPIVIEAGNAVPGEWSYTIEGINVPSIKYSYVVLAGQARDDLAPPGEDPGNSGKKRSSGCFIETIR
jgi:hypothetical protein